MSRKKSKTAKKKATVLGTSADMPRADFSKSLDQGFEDTFYGQKGTVADVARLVADGTEDSGLLRSPPIPDAEWTNTPPYGVITLIVAVLVSVYFISAFLALSPVPSA